MKYIISYNENCEKLCFLELERLNKNFSQIQQLSNQKSLIEIDLDNKEFTDIIINQPLVFTRHKFKVDKIINKPFSNSSITEFLTLNLNKQQTYSIQYQTNLNFKNKDFNVNEISDQLNNQNYTLDVKNPTNIVSVFENEFAIFIGIGNRYLNLSNFKGGEPHFSKKQEFVSRAEYKLLEALDLAGINIDNMKFSADLGAAPGGWTKVLASKNLNVHAIDPASLSPDVLKYKNVEHFRMTTEQYLQKFDSKEFDIIVNDMKMASGLSCKIILDFYDRLKQNGYVIMTLKLAKDFSYNEIIKSIKTLQTKYKLLLSRQLFHNRSEITVILQKENI